MAIFAHFLLFLLQYSLFSGTIIDFMLNNIKYNHTDAFLKNWLSASRAGESEEFRPTPTPDSGVGILKNADSDSRLRS